MTDKVNPSINRPAEAFKTAGAIALAGGSDAGWIASGATEISTQDAGVDETALNAFAQTSSASSFDVTIDPGEAFIYGSWSAIDTATTVTLAASTLGQTVYVGWNKDSTDDVIVGLQAAFDNASGNTDQKIPLFDFDTDGSGVTSVTDRRTIGQTVTATNSTYDADGNGTVDNSEALNGKDRIEHILDTLESFPRTTLEDTESVEKDIPVFDTETLTVYRWGVHRTSDDTAPSGLEVQLLDETDTVQSASSTVDNQSTSGVTSLTNSTASQQFYTVRLINNSGATEDVAGHMAYIVE